MSTSLRGYTDKVESRLIENGSSMSLRNSQPNGISKPYINSISLWCTLSEWTGCDFDPGSPMIGFRMSRSMTSKLTEPFQFIHRQFKSKQMEKDILQTASMSIPTLTCRKDDVRKNKSIPVQPVRVFRVEFHKFVPEDVTHGCHAHRCARMARICLCGHINCQTTDCVDGFPIELRVRRRFRHFGECTMEDDSKEIENSLQ
jgi:hypothetical protein